MPESPAPDNDLNEPTHLTPSEIDEFWENDAADLSSGDAATFLARVSNFSELIMRAVASDSADNAESTNQVYAALEREQAALIAELDRPDLSPEERVTIFEQIRENRQAVISVDSGNKEHIRTQRAILIVGLTTLLGTLGAIGLKKLK